MGTCVPIPCFQKFSWRICALIWDVPGTSPERSPASPPGTPRGDTQALLPGNWVPSGLFALALSGECLDTGWLQKDHPPLKPCQKSFPELEGCSETDQAQRHCHWRLCLLVERTLAAPANIYTAHLPTTPGIICTRFTHCHIAHLIPLLPGLLEVGGDHLRSGGSTACQSCCDPAEEQTNHEHFKHGEGRKSACCGACAGARPTAHTWGEVPCSPESCDPTIPELRNLPRHGGTWKNFILPVGWSGEFFLFVRTTGRIIIPVIIKAVIGVLRVIKHRPAPCSAPVEWERWSDVSQSLDSLLPSSLPSVCLVPSLPPPHAPSPPCTHTLRDGVGTVFAILASQTAHLLGYYLGCVCVLLLLLLLPSMGWRSQAAGDWWSWWIGGEPLNRGVHCR